MSARDISWGCAMAKTDGRNESKRVVDTTSARQYQYRGQSIVIQDGGGPRRDGDMGTASASTATRSQPTLKINGRKVQVEKSDGGYLSHDFMFKEYGTLDELAEDLVRQWGTATIEPGGHPPVHGSSPDVEPAPGFKRAGEPK